VALRFKLDENMPDEAAALLRQAGHDVRGALEQQLGGRADERLSHACQQEGRVLVTPDLDFSDIRAYAPADYPGIWVLRPHLQSIDNVLALVRAALALTSNEKVAQRLWIIEPGHLRIRQ
jgi:predicted nuclease of predicted toxin-antitoxin system